MENFFMCIVSSLITGSLASSCTTPLGVRSQCVSLYGCPSLVAAFNLKPLPNSVALFVKKSLCGFKGNIPNVCCGPLPSQNYLEKTHNRNTNSHYNNNNNDINNNRGSNVRINRLSPDQIERLHDEDSRPASRSHCGVETNGDRIFGGTKTELNEFPWMALLGYRNRSSGGLTYKCGGMLINNRYVITAAHCITGQIEVKVGRLETIRLGEYDTRTEVDCLDGTCADRPQEIPVQIAVAHPGFIGDNSRRDDIGIARLAQRAQYNYYVQPICLVSNDLRLDDGSEVFVAGWGKTSSGTYSDVKKKLTLPIFRKDECISKYGRVGVSISDKQICAGGTFSSDTCKGDSGGPLMRKRPEGIWESVAIVSFGNGCGKDGWPGIYTSVAHYRDWIDQTMRSTNV